MLLLFHLNTVAKIMADFFQGSFCFFMFRNNNLLRLFPFHFVEVILRLVVSSRIDFQRLCN